MLEGLLQMNDELFQVARVAGVVILNTSNSEVQHSVNLLTITVNNVVS